MRPDSSIAQRSKTTGHLVITMPKEDPSDASAYDVTLTRPGPSQGLQAGAAAGSISRAHQVALRGLPGRPLGQINGPLAGGPRCGGGSGRGGGAGAGGPKGATVWERDLEGNLVARQLQRATLVEASAAAAGGPGGEAGEGDGDDLPPL